MCQSLHIAEKISNEFDLRGTPSDHQWRSCIPQGGGGNIEGRMHGRCWNVSVKLDQIPKKNQMKWRFSILEFGESLVKEQLHL